MGRGPGHSGHQADSAGHHHLPSHPLAHGVHPPTGCALSPAAKAALKAPLGVPAPGGADIPAALRAAAAGATKGVPAALLPAAPVATGLPSWAGLSALPVGAAAIGAGGALLGGGMAARSLFSGSGSGDGSGGGGPAGTDTLATLPGTLQTQPTTLTLAASQPPVHVPEPSGASLLAGALLLLLLVRCRPRRGRGAHARG
ncbi:MAG TPA: hypothetical protein VFN46_05780 [Acetobacteraceae bacterium]|nr:hypothetical protein [Acetobacteraceae bacterium]